MLINRKLIAFDYVTESGFIQHVCHEQQTK